MSNGLPFKYDDSDSADPKMWVEFNEYELVNIIAMLIAQESIGKAVGFSFDNGDWHGQMKDKLASALDGLRHKVDPSQHMAPNVSVEETLSEFSDRYTKSLEEKLQELIAAASALLGATQK